MLLVDWLIALLSSSISLLIICLVVLSIVDKGMLKFLDGFAPFYSMDFSLHILQLYFFDATHLV
jgi:hypothetical protein